MAICGKTASYSSSADITAPVSHQSDQRPLLKFLILNKYANAGSLNREVSTCECTDALVGQRALKTALLLTQRRRVEVGDMQERFKSKSPLRQSFSRKPAGPSGARVLLGNLARSMEMSAGKEHKSWIAQYKKKCFEQQLQGQLSHSCFGKLELGLSFKLKCFH